MITMGILKKWITDTLKNDATYEALCLSTVGAKLGYYRSSPADQIVEALPFFTAFTSESSQDFVAMDGYTKTWDVPCALGIDGSYDNAGTDDSGVTIWSGTDKAEILAANAIEILRDTARNCGINGEDVQVLETRIIISEVGEFDDIQASIFIKFGLHTSI
jgi:hypothetical protein